MSGLRARVSLRTLAAAHAATHPGAANEPQSASKDAEKGAEDAK